MTISTSQPHSLWVIVFMICRSKTKKKQKKHKKHIYIYISCIIHLDTHSTADFKGNQVINLPLKATRSLLIINFYSTSIFPYQNKFSFCMTKKPKKPVKRAIKNSSLQTLHPIFIYNETISDYSQRVT